jgi:ABC-type multidrug transport system ATPase subunit
VQEAHRHADRVIVLDRGELLFDGSPLALMQDVEQAGADFEHALVIFLAEQAAR